MLTGGKCALIVDGTSSEEVRTIACDVLDKVFYFLHSILGDLGIMGSGQCWVFRIDKHTYSTSPGS